MRRIIPAALTLMLGATALAASLTAGLAFAQTPHPAPANQSTSGHTSPRHLAGPHPFWAKGTSSKIAHAHQSSASGAGYQVGDLIYNGGPVQENPAAYVILWGSSWSTNSGAGQVIDNYFHDMGHTAFQNTMTQYYDGTQNITNSLNLGGVWVDTTNPPIDSTNCASPAVDDSSLQAEVTHAISTNGWPDDANNATYFVYTPSGDVIYQPAFSLSPCSDTLYSTIFGLQGYCAYHSYVSGTQSFAYGAMPWPDNDGNPATSICPALENPNGSSNTAGDSEVNLTSHEQSEAMTDPQLDAWWDSNASSATYGAEIGDLCAWIDNGTTALNNGHQYWMQPEYSNFTHSCLNYSRSWFFAEGFTGGSFTTYLTLANGAGWPNRSATTADVAVEYLLGSGSPIVKNYTVNANARSTLNINTEVATGQNVSMVVFSDAPIVAERPEYFTFKGGGMSVPGGTDVLGANQPATSFDFGYLDTTTNHSTFLTILNQNPSGLTATIQYFPAAGGSPITKMHTINAASRGTVSVNSEGLSAGSYSALVSLSLPGLAERPMYLVDSITGQTGAADVVGVPTPGTRWSFAEGFTNANFSERYILSNPTTSSATAHATVTYYEANGTTITDNVTLSPGQQQVVSANSDLGNGVNNSATVTSDNPILAERFMSFVYHGAVGGSSSSTIPGATDVLGAPSIGTSYQFAEGATITNFAEYLTLQNPGGSTVTVTVTYLPSNGSPPTVKTYNVNAHSRFTVNTSKDMPGQSFSMLVTAPSAIVAERPMYFNYKGSDTGGTDVIGYQPLPAN